MPLEIEVDQSSDVPVYRQIVEKITSRVRAGTLQPGDRVPPERELAKQLGTARGTVTKAYEELARSGILDLAQGRGSFVSSRQDVIPTSRMEQAIESINTLVNKLSSLRFSLREIKSMVDLVILEQEDRLENLHIAAIDCCPEALGSFCRQLNFQSWIPITTILLDDLASKSNPEKRLAEFDLVITTVTHHSEVLGMAHGLKDRLVQVAVTPSQETIINLAGIKPSQTIGILSEGRPFLEIIKKKLDDFGIANRVANLFAPWNAEQLEEFVADKDVLIVPPDFQTALDRATSPVVAVFTEGGGKIIPFDYQIERGSLVYLEERINNLTER